MVRLGLVLLFTFHTSLFLVAQTTVPSTGKNASGSGGTISYTVGQIDYSVNTGASGTLNTGVQQPYEISIITSIKEASGISLEFSTYPNPVNSILILSIKNYDSEKLFYRLIDISGRTLEMKKVNGSITEIPMDRFSSGYYFLLITENTKEIKSFRIIKN